MCGIVGYITNETTKGVARRNKVFTQSLILDTLRGSHSTGLFYSPATEGEGMSPGYLKACEDGYAFTRRKGYDEFVNDSDPAKFLIGHNRYATTGAITTDNAHPFQEGPITLVHNGSLTTTHNLPKSQRELGVDVDSHALCHNLAIADVEEVVKNIQGAFALVWHDKRDDSINIIRNSQRPLHLAELTTEETIVLMSEAEMLHAVLKRNNIVAKAIVQPDPGQYLKFKSGDICNPEIRQLELHTYYQNYNNNRGWYGNQSNKYFPYHEADDVWDELSQEMGGSPRHVKKPVPPKRPAAPLVPSESNKVKVGGCWREVPNGQQEMLLDIDMVVEDRYQFVPMKATPYGKDGQTIVSGYLNGIEGGGVTAIFYGMAMQTYEKLKDRCWTVRPVGVKWLAVDEPAVIVNMYSTQGDKLPVPVEQEDGDDRTYPGPRESMVTESEWDEATASGCCNCGRALYLGDAWEINWTNLGFDPLCPSCVKNWDGFYGGVIH